MKNILKKLNKLDILVIVATLIVLAIFGFRKVSTVKEDSIAQKSLVIKFKTTAVSQNNTNKINVGDEIYDFRTNSYIGNVIDVKISDAMDVYRDKEGRLTQPITIEGYKTIEFDVETKGNIGAAKILLDGKYEICMQNAIEINNKDMYLKVRPLVVEEK